MRLFTSLSTDRIAGSAACSYGLFWIIALGTAILDKKNFQPNLMFYIAVGCAVFYVSLSALVLGSVKGSSRLLQITTVIATVLILAAFCTVFLKQGILGRGIIVAFGQLQIVYAISVCLLLKNKCQTSSD